IISEGSADLPRVFATLLAHAVALCGADGGGIYLVDGEVLRNRARHNPVDMPEEVQRAIDTLPLTRQLLFGRAVLDGRTNTFAGTRAAYPRAYPATVVQPDQPPGPLARLAAPIRRGGTVIGVFNLRRQGRRPFTAAEVALAESFADQAAIAIENARLLQREQQS